MAVRVPGVLHPGSGGAALQSNVLGDLDLGRRIGVVDIPASSVHIRRLPPGGETLPCELRGRLTSLADFAVIPIASTWVKLCIRIKDIAMLFLGWPVDIVGGQGSRRLVKLLATSRRKSP